MVRAATLSNRDRLIGLLLQLLRRHGLTWRQLVEAAAGQADPSSSEPQWRLLRRQCLARPEALTEWEHAFLLAIGAQARISPRQLAILEQIAAELQEAAR